MSSSSVARWRVATTRASDRHRPSHPAHHATLSWTGLGGGQTYQWFATVNDGTTTTTGPTWTFHTAAETSGTVVSAIGDLATCTETGDTETAAIMAGIDGPIITTGDNVYQTGTLAEFNACYEPTWGPFKARTRPVPGNHDWGNGVRTPASLTDYFTYFGANANAGGTSYYSYDLDANWHVVNLDSECANVPGGGCAAGSDQHDWLVADLAANASKNVIAVWHKPRFSSGSTNLVAMSDLVTSLYAAGVDIGLVGHDHIYEVFQPLDPDGNFDPAFGIRHMTVGTGGAEHHAAGTPEADEHRSQRRHLRGHAARPPSDELRVEVLPGRRSDIHRLGQLGPRTGRPRRVRTAWTSGPAAPMSRSATRPSSTCRHSRSRPGSSGPAPASRTPPERAASRNSSRSSPTAVPSRTARTSMRTGSWASTTRRTSWLPTSRTPPPG